nr:retrovirus-related Pol polyprotein from transposon TNT 1-94 [Tanacetum cinerariifolium]
MFKLDLEPLSPKVLKNKDAHIDYIKHTQENADILQELVKRARGFRPLDSDLEFACTVRFSNDQIAKIMGYGDYQMGNVMISQVAFRKHTCYIRDLEGVDLLKGSMVSNLSTLSLEDMMLSSPFASFPKRQKSSLGYGIEEAVTTVCYTQNRSLIRNRHNKTPYGLLHNKKPDLFDLHVFGALCYPTNNSEDLGKLKPKADIGIFVGYAPTKKAY